jgi:hypothetical protein
MSEIPGQPRHGVRNVSQAPKLWTTPDKVNEPLYCVVPVFNAQRFKARWKHAVRAIEHFVNAGAVVYVVEVAFGEREHALEDFMPHKVEAICPPIQDELLANCRHDDVNRGLHRYIKLRTNQVLWLKENAINIGVNHLPRDWKYMCMLDADIAFAKPNWVADCIQQLQHYKVLQMFSQAHDLDAGYQVLGTKPCFVQNYLNGHTLEGGYYGGKKFANMWSGLAWAWRRDAWDAVGGIQDRHLHGGGDWFLAWSLIEQVERSMRKDLHPSYKDYLYRYEALCKRHIRRDIGYMSGSVFHMHHGPKSQRKYADRHKLLAVTQYDPIGDIRTDAQGLIQLIDDGSERFIWLRDGLRQYAAERNEDDPNI